MDIHYRHREDMIEVGDLQLTRDTINYKYCHKITFQNKLSQEF